MPTSIEFCGSQFEVADNETVLEALLRQGIEVPNSCRAGACQCCMMRAVEGDIPAQAQAGLRPALKEQGYFLSCSCHPSGPMVLETPGDEINFETHIIELQDLGANVLRVALALPHGFDYRPGQFITLTNPDGIARSYSLASLPAEGVIELHVRGIPGGLMSTWLFQHARKGDTVKIAGPSGECFYTEGNPDQPILLVGTGTGLAPLWGILRDAIARGHRAPIVLYHGALDPSGLYLRKQLNHIMEEHPPFTYHPCVIRDSDNTTREGAIDQLVLNDIGKLTGWRAYLCGNPDLVKMLKKKFFLAGMNMKDISMDAFIPSIAAPAA